MENIHLVKDYFNYLKENDIKGFFSLLSDNITWNQPGNSTISGQYRGKDAIGKLLSEIGERSNGTFAIDKVHSIINNNGLVKVDLTFSAKQNETVLKMKGTDILQITNGKINEVWLYSDNQTLEDQFWDLKTNY